MESSIVVIVVLVTVITVVVLFLTTFCYIYKYCHKERAHKYRYSPLPQPEEDIELEQHYDSSAHSISYSHSTEPCDTELGQLSSSLSSLSQDYRPVESDGPEDYKERPVVHLPYQLHNFVVQKIIPYFNDQRLTAYQFAVVVLLSESDFDNICQTNFTPSDIWGRPILNKAFSVMPQDLKKYGNYVVARPSSNNCHSEEEIFGKYSVIDTPFYHLWSAYVERNGAYPKCILIYSWNLPCSRCTEAIIRSLGKKPYNGVSVIVAHTIFWMRSESDSQHKMNQEKLISKNITVEQVQYPVHLPPGQITSIL